MPNWRKDQRKTRTTEGRCALANCSRPTEIIYYNLGLCDTHFDYYFDEDMPSPILKKILGLSVTAAEYEEAVARRREFERNRRKAKKAAKENAESEEFEDGLFKTLDRRERARKKKMDRDDGWVPDL